VDSYFARGKIPLPGDAKPAAAASSDPAAPFDPALACPRCKSRLVDPAGIGWCQRCNYCRTLENDKDKVPTPAARKTPSNLTGGGPDFFRLIAHLPSWFWTLLIGMGVYTAMSVIIGKQLEPDLPTRAIWCTIQIFVGLVLILGAHFWAMTYLAPDDDKLGIKDVLLPGRLWLLMFRNMPAMRWPVWITGWGFAIIVSGLIFIGGLSHWMNYLPGTKTAQNAAKTK